MDRHVQVIGCTFLTFDTYRCEWDVELSRELDKIVTGSKRFFARVLLRLRSPVCNFGIIIA